MFTIPGVHGPARGKVYLDCFQSFQKGGTVVITRLFKGVSRKTWKNHACSQAGEMKTDLFNHEPHERHEKTRFSSVSCGSWLKPRFGFRWGGLFLGTLLLLGLGGCASVETVFGEKMEKMEKSTNFFLDHPCPLVRIPSIIGATPGAVTGFPIFATGYIINEIVYPSKIFNWLMVGCVPSITAQVAGTHLAGAPCWALFGWWWPEKYNLETVESQKTGESEIPQSLEPPDGKPEKKKPES